MYISIITEVTVLSKT